MDKEPAAIVGTITAVVTAAIALLVAFGVNLTDEQQKAILAMVAAVAPVAAALIIRGRVYAPATTQALVDDAAATGTPADVDPPPPTKTIPVSKWGVYNRDNGTGGDTAA